MDFERLALHSPRLAAVLADDALDLTNPTHLFEIQRATLKIKTGVDFSLPKGFLIPSVCRSENYLNAVRALVPKPKTLVDVGSGANCVFGLLTRHVFGAETEYLGIEIDASACEHASNNLKVKVVNGDALLRETWELFDEPPCLVVCNPPFFGSMSEAHKLAFGGKPHEVCCEGGEVSFVRSLIDCSPSDSRTLYTTMLGRSSSLEGVLMKLFLTGKFNTSVCWLNSRVLIAWRSGSEVPPLVQRPWRRAFKFKSLGRAISLEVASQRLEEFAPLETTSRYAVHADDSNRVWLVGIVERKRTRSEMDRLAEDLKQINRYWRRRRKVVV